MFEVACERGAGSVTVAHVVERSGVSRRTFYELFVDREDCFLAALDEAVACTTERVLPAYRAGESWQEQIRGGLIALLGLLDEEPLVGRLLIAESLAAGQAALERRRELLASVIAAVGAGHEQSKGGVTAPALTAEATVGGVLSVIHARLLEPVHGPLLELSGQLMSMIVLPYLGVQAARREAQRALPHSLVVQTHEHEPVLLADPFKEAGMRLTYRTVRVLTAVAERPNASNRTIGDQAEIKDQGQISKLLGRLERIGLVSNTGLGPGQGAPNAWSLTPRGRQVVQSVQSDTHSTTRRGNER
jgi:AcrR family transcriptional regulator/DNA-binding MarR family transcriptional regulator